MSVDEKFEVAVIGGGINGAGIARDLALRGIRTVLLEKDDFGSGTTSYSTRLIHGGLRYLETMQFGLVYESLHERQVLMRIANHLVYPMPIVLPVYKGQQYGRPVLWMGMLLYDLLSLNKSLPNHRALSRQKLLELIPAMNPAGLRGGFSYYDCQAPLPERLTLENVLDAEAHGATCLNYTEVVEIDQADSEYFQVDTVGLASGSTQRFLARVIINAGGPWANRIAALVDEQAPRLVGGTKGTHLIVDNRIDLQEGLYAPAESDGRPFFIIPLNPTQLLIGTTDIFFNNLPETARASADEVAYLLFEANHLCPELALVHDDISLTYCGVRPLPPAARKKAGEVTRKHFFYRHKIAGKKAPIVSVIGGKITTYRHLAQEAGDLACKLLGKRRRPSRSHKIPLPGALRIGEKDRLPVQEKPFPQQEGTSRLLFGAALAKIQEMERSDPRLAAPIRPGMPETLAMIAYSAQHEKVRHLDDFMLRRTLLGLQTGVNRELAEAVAAELARHLQWEPERQAQEVARYLGKLQESLAWRKQLYNSD